MIKDSRPTVAGIFPPTARKNLSNPLSRTRKLLVQFLYAIASKLLCLRGGIERLFLAEGGKVPATVGRDSEAGSRKFSAENYG